MSRAKIAFLVAVTVLFIVAVVFACRGGDDEPTESSGSSSSTCPYKTTSSKTETAYDGSTARVKNGTCIKPKPGSGEGAVNLQPFKPPKWGLTEEKQKTLQQQGKIYAVFDITPDGHTWSPPIEITIILSTPGPHEGYRLTIFQWNQSRNDWTDAGTAEVLEQLTKARGQITHTSLFALVDEEAAAEVRVPNVVGWDIDDAQDALWEAGLEIGDVSEEPMSDQEAGSVIWQSHDPGDRVPLGTAIDLIVAGRVEELRVPDVLGMNIEEAMDEIWGRGLEVGGVSEEPAPVAEPDTVIGQDPQPGALVEPGTAVHLVVGVPEPLDAIFVPDVIGMNVDVAAEEIGAAGLEIAEVKQEQGTGEAPGTVLSQSPEPYAKVPPGTAVYLLVAEAEPSKPPTAAFFAEALEGAEVVDDNLVWAGCEFTLLFVNQSSNADWFFWDFGDGSTSEEYEPIHAYSAPEGDSVFSVRLVVRGPGGKDEVWKDDFIQTQCIR